MVCVTGFVIPSSHSRSWFDSNDGTVLSTGNVARGCLSMLEELPLKKISVRELQCLGHSEGWLLILEANYPLS